MQILFTGKPNEYIEHNFIRFPNTTAYSEFDPFLLHVFPMTAACMLHFNRMISIHCYEIER